MASPSEELVLPPRTGGRTRSRALPPPLEYCPRCGLEWSADEHECDPEATSRPERVQRVKAATDEDGLPIPPKPPTGWERAFPDTVGNLSLQELSDAMQMAAALCSHTAALLGQVEGRYYYLMEDGQERIDAAVARWKLANPEEAKAIGQVDAVRAYVTSTIPELAEIQQERATMRSHKHRLEGMLASYEHARSTLSRQLEARAIEARAASST